MSEVRLPNQRQISHPCAFRQQTRFQNTKVPQMHKLNDLQVRQIAPESHARCSLGEKKVPTLQDDA